MVLDGAIDADDWTGKWQMAHLTDMDEIWRSFFTDCFAAREKYPLWRNGDERVRVGVGGIEKRVGDVMKEVRRAQLFAVRDERARVITYRDVRMAIVQAMFVPSAGFPALARFFDQLLRRETDVQLE